LNRISFGARMISSQWSISCPNVFTS